MSSIVTFAEKLFEPFEVRPFGAVDSLIFSTLAYTRIPGELEAACGWEGVRLVELLRAECMDDMYRLMWSPDNAKRLLLAAAMNPRYRDVRVCGYHDELDPGSEKQFSAMTFKLWPGCSYVAFRGTDNTLVGWKEDFNMAFRCPVPAQEEAVRYVDRAAAELEGELMLGGHSKGGNLAVYSAAKCGTGVRDRVVRAYSHDGPGFMEQVLRDDDFVRAAEKVEKTLPQASVVGMLLEDQENYRVVKSRGLSVLQHDPFLWEVEGSELVMLERISPDARYMDRALHEWVAQMSEREREHLVDTLYGIINANGHVTFEEWRADLGATLPAMAEAAARVDRETAGFLGRMLVGLAKVGLRSVPAMFESVRG